MSHGRSLCFPVPSVTMADPQPTEPPDDDGDRGSRTSLVGVGIAIGAGFGAVYFAISGNPIWIAIGAGLGVVFGAVLSNRR
jgi:hypothetical protein